MEQKKIDRINELAHKAKAEGLTEEEQKEREVLRQEYLDAIMGNLRRELDNTYIVDEKGNKRKLRHKGRASRLRRPGRRSCVSSGEQLSACCDRSACTVSTALSGGTDY